MLKALKRLFDKTNKKLHSKILEWLEDPEYWAKLYVEEYTSQIIKILEERGMTLKDFADEAGVTKSAITQFLDISPNVSVITLFKYADYLDLTIDTPKLIKKDFENFYKEHFSETVKYKKEFSERIQTESHGETKINEFERSGPTKTVRLHKINESQEESIYQNFQPTGS